MIELPEDFRDLLLALCDAGADFVVVGGHAVAFHGHPRATKDLDVALEKFSSATPIGGEAVAAAGASHLRELKPGRLRRDAIRLTDMLL